MTNIVFTPSSSGALETIVYARNITFKVVIKSDVQHTTVETLLSSNSDFNTVIRRQHIQPVEINTYLISLMMKLGVQHDDLVVCLK
ncbi:hypothetical protein L0B53_19275 (plasmid) [Vibrio sp. SS-MA-C1-2]|uniref:hypothetical protein n=1 Tax=Vibrio sp. SS-MA-C1-2 TaxID=2908646 RepID=UPI001F2F9C29|nr:hypothetical protein [Vibrio sp. SS-MA-C1-2]UJF20277.1 hypothetical protein L0B53_19275 [Vibrio sp. SS-MA-C1-2]